jgi:hypothetical protein
MSPRDPAADHPQRNALATHGVRCRIFVGQCTEIATLKCDACQRPACDYHGGEIPEAARVVPGIRFLCATCEDE